MRIVRTNPQIEARIINKCAALARHTAPVCANDCRRPHSCCDTIFCNMAIANAKEEWNVELAKTDHPTLPLMGPNGCTAAPHLRPLCTMHVCCIDRLGYKPNDPAWTKKYYGLRDEISRLELWRSDEAEENVAENKQLVRDSIAYASQGLNTPIPLKVREWLERKRKFGAEFTRSLWEWLL